MQAPALKVNSSASVDLMVGLQNAVWQHPFVDVFRYCNVKQWPQGNFAKEGNVKVAMVCKTVCGGCAGYTAILYLCLSRHIGRVECIHKVPQTIAFIPFVTLKFASAQDRSIGHQVVTLAGAVPAANFLQLPQATGDSLALTGKFLYLQVPRCLVKLSRISACLTQHTACPLLQTPASIS